MLSDVIHNESLHLRRIAHREENARSLNTSILGSLSEPARISYLLLQKYWEKCVVSAMLN